MLIDGFLITSRLLCPIVDYRVTEENSVDCFERGFSSHSAEDNILSITSSEDMIISRMLFD